MDEMRKQAMRFGSEVVNGFVHDVKLNEHPFRVYYGDQQPAAADPTGAEAGVLSAALSSGRGRQHT